jgi:hypothetical protein
MILYSYVGLQQIIVGRNFSINQQIILADLKTLRLLFRHIFFMIVELKLQLIVKKDQITSVTVYYAFVIIF